MGSIPKVFYHEALVLSTRKDTMNVYEEKLTSDREKALVFHDDEEAKLMASFLELKSHFLTDKAEVEPK